MRELVLNQKRVIWQLFDKPPEKTSGNAMVDLLAQKKEEEEKTKKSEKKTI